MTNPGVSNQRLPAQQSQTQPSQARQPARGRSGTLGDYSPQPVDQPAGGYTIPQEQPGQPLLLPDNSQSRGQLPSTPTTQGGYQLSEQAYQAQQIQRLTHQAQSQSPYPDLAQSGDLPPIQSQAQGYEQGQSLVREQGPLTYAPVQSSGNSNTARQPQQSDIYGPYVPYVPPAPVAVQLGDATPHNLPPQREVTDVLPTAKYVPNAKGQAENGLVAPGHRGG